MCMTFTFSFIFFFYVCGLRACLKLALYTASVTKVLNVIEDCLAEFRLLSNLLFSNCANEGGRYAEW